MMARTALTAKVQDRLRMTTRNQRRYENQTVIDVAPKIYPAGTGVWRVKPPCPAVMGAVRGVEPSGERSAADRRAAAYVIGVIQPSRE